MRRKRITIPINTLSDRLRGKLIAAVKKQHTDVDADTIEITALVRHEYTPKTFARFVCNVQHYIAANGNRRVNRQELARIGKTTRPTLNKWAREMLIVPAGFREWEECDRMYYTYCMKSASECYMPDGANKNEFDLQEIVNYPKNFTK